MNHAAPREAGLAPPPPLDLRRVSFFADLDGTLAPICATPDQVGPDGDRRRLLKSLSNRLDGRFAVISGRGLEDLDRVLEGGVRPVAAIHGLVRRTAGDEVIAPTAGPERVREASRALHAFARREPRLLVEDKSHAVALHYRSAPGMGAACEETAERLAGELDLDLQPGSMVVELKLPGPDKGAALQAFMREPPFAGFPPVYLGDDLTDEAAFKAARTLSGFGVLVGARTPTAALYALTDIAAARDWLVAALDDDR